MEPKIKNAIIKGAEISNADHGLLSAWVHLDYGGGGQGFGGYALYLPKDFTKSTNQHNFAGHFIWRVLEVAGVNRWSELKGKTIRVKADWGKVYAIGHIVNDIWFDPEKEFEEMRLCSISSS